MKTRVLVIDDSSVVRRLLSATISEDPELEVVATVGDAVSALEKLRTLAPDVVTLDVEMPDVGGLDLLVQIRQVAPRLPVIMYSSLTERAAVATLEALARGASDYATKPSGAAGKDAAMEQVRQQLVPKIKALGKRAALVALSSAKKRPVAAAPGIRPAVLAIGASTGGPNALCDLLRALGPDFPLPIVITQHMPVLFTQLLADRLRAVSRLDCREAKGGEALVPGAVFVAPGDYHLLLERIDNRVVTVLDRGPPENSCRPSVDPMFRSVSDIYGARALAVVLTGMGQDGLRGSEQLRKAGGRVLVQDEASSIVWGMPGFVARAGLADAEADVLSLARVIRERAGLIEVKHAG